MKYTYRIVIRKDTNVDWENSIYIPLEGEPCLDTTTNTLKFGNGTDLFKDLEGISGASSTTTGTGTVSDEHLNALVLEKFGEDTNGFPTYNGVAIDTTIAQRDVYDGLDSLDNTISLSANQGKTLNDKITTLENTPNTGTPSELEKITEGSNTGWRLLSSDPLNYGDIGSGAIDFSISTIESSTNGATGLYSFASGKNTTASGANSRAEGVGTIAKNFSSHVAGIYNEGLSLYTIHETGIGYDSGGTIIRKNAFEIYTDGTLTAPESTIASINTRGDKTLITKEYVDSLSSGELKTQDQGNDIGWTLQCRIDNPTHYGNIGDGAVDFSASYAIGAFGATGTHSFAIGTRVKASGASSTAFGYITEASGYSSHAEGYATSASGSSSHAEGYVTIASGFASHTEGYNTTASGNYGSHAEGSYATASGFASHAEGYKATASGENSHAEGYYTTALNLNSHAAGQYNIGTSTETIHETGIGADNDNRKNAFEIYTDGTLTAPEATPALVQNRGSQALVPMSYLFSAEFGSALPIVDPGVPGTPWNNAGVLSISV